MANMNLYPNLHNATLLDSASQIGHLEILLDNLKLIPLTSKLKNGLSSNTREDDTTTTMVKRGGDQFSLAYKFLLQSRH
jgi:hypothetical protein